MKKCSNGHHLHYAITPNYTKWGDPWYCNECLESFPGESCAYWCRECGRNVIYCYNCFNCQKADVPEEPAQDNENTFEIVHNETSPNSQEHENKSPLDDKEKHLAYKISTQNTRAFHTLRKELSKLKENPVEGFSVGLVNDRHLFTWEVLIMGPPDTHNGGGIFKSIIKFPDEYPTMPPMVTFISDIWHPNVDKNGKVCLSIFNHPDDEPFGHEEDLERWLPVYTVDTIMLFVLSMLANPDDRSPANIDAAKEFRENPSYFKKNVLRCVKKSHSCES